MGFLPELHKSILIMNYINTDLGGWEVKIRCVFRPELFLWVSGTFMVPKTQWDPDKFEAFSFECWGP